MNLGAWSTTLYAAAGASAVLALAGTSPGPAAYALWAGLLAALGYSFSIGAATEYNPQENN